MASHRVRRDLEEKTVILDSSALLMPFEFSVDLEQELTRLLGKYHIVVPAPIVRELRVLSQRGDGRKKRIAVASLKLVERYSLVEVNEEHGDDAVVRLAKELNGVVVTNDRELRGRLQAISIPVVFLRGKQILFLE